MWLHTNHNNGIQLPNTVRWSDYIQTIRSSDRASFLDTQVPFNSISNSGARHRSGNCHYLYSECNATETLEKAFEIREANECFWWDHQRCSVRTNELKEKNVALINLLDNATVQERYPSAPRFGYPIVSSSFGYLIVSSSFACNGNTYVDPVVTSLDVQLAASDIIPPTHKYDTLHVRRGRGKILERCDKSVPSIMRYLHNTTAGKEISSTIMVFTDETDEAYLKELYSSLEMFNRWKKIRRGDQEIISKYSNITASDNYMTYAIASTIIGNSVNQYGTGTKQCQPNGELIYDTYAYCHPCTKEFFKGTSEQLKSIQKVALNCQKIDFTGV